MATIHLVGCGKLKLSDAAPARDLYTGPLFQKSLAYAEHQPGPTFVLSALHGLVDLDQELWPYDTTMGGLSVRETAAWAYGVCSALYTRGYFPRRTHVVYLCGQAYIDPLSNRNDSGLLPSWHAPMHGKGIGERLAWLNTQLRRIERQQDRPRSSEGRVAA